MWDLIEVGHCLLTGGGHLSQQMKVILIMHGAGEAKHPQALIFLETWPFHLQRLVGYYEFLGILSPNAGA